MNKETTFFWQVIRNGFILSGLYFVSVFAVGTLTWEAIKPIVIFYLSYVFTEFARHYKISTQNLPKKSKPIKSMLWT